MSTRTATTTATTTVTTSVSTITTPGSATNVGTGLDTPTLFTRLDKRRSSRIEEQEKQKDVWRYEQEQ
ncbi:hypothetical protein EB796_009861 [Bugula neritina]|uniref:Uncharacterized protein n=1 Tax=Bugula neritina TaxID=10212 RepID=A0A7J7K2P3_BUGNE|nr:hypothetical protein EB796_009861 [Bugula neritina]